MWQILLIIIYFLKYYIYGNVNNSVCITRFTLNNYV
jgi:hypothetical protein